MADNPMPLAFLTRVSPPALTAIAVVLVGLIGAIDLVSGYEISFGLFYLGPVVVGTYASKRTGLVVAALSATTWLAANALTEPSGRISLVLLSWNAATRLGSFAVVSLLLSSLLGALRREAALARVDHNTQVANSRAFREQAATEIERARRYGHSLTVAYIDIDDFKAVNDTFGHGTGDELLRAVGSTLKSSLRSIDLVGRVGGDEFVLLLPETPAEAAEPVAAKLRSALATMAASYGLPVTFSIGMVTCRRPSLRIETLLLRADHLMYEVKSSGKNASKHEVIDSDEKGVRNLFQEEPLGETHSPIEKGP